MADKTVIVGRVAVKVSPDTSHFKKELKAKLERLESSLGPLEIDVDLNLDAKHLTEKVKQAQREAQRAADEITLRVNADYDDSVKSAIDKLERELVRLGEQEVKVKLNADDITDTIELLQSYRKIELDIDKSSEASVRKALSRVQAELDRMKEVRIDVSMDEDSLLAMQDELESDLKKFEQKARLTVRYDDFDEASLRRALNQVDAELEKLRKPKFEIDVDETSLEATRHVIQNELDAIEREQQIILEFDKAAAKKAIDDMADRIDAEMKNIEFNPKADLRNIGRALDDIESRMWRIEDIKSKITYETDEKSLREAERTMRKLQDEIDEIESQIKVDVANPGLEKAKAQLALLARSRFVTLIPVVSKTAAKNAATALSALSGARVIGDILSNLWDGVKNLDKAVPKIATVGSAFIGLTASIASSVSNVAALTASLLSMAPLALSLPGIVGGLGIGLGITVIALKDLNEVLPKIKTGFKEIGQQISDNFWKKAKTPISELSDILLPKLKSRLSTTSTAIGDWFGGFAKAIGQSLVPAMDGMFRSLDDSIGIFKKATKPLAGILTSLGKMGSEQLPELARWAGELVAQFDAWLKKIQQNGVWDQWVKDAKQAFKDLGRVFKNTYKILREIGGIAKDSGGASLGTFADTLERIYDTVRKPQFQNGLKGLFQGGHGFFQGLGEASDELLGLFEALGQTFSVVAPRIGEAIGALVASLADALAKPSVQQGIKDFFNGVASAVEDIAPVMPDIAEAFGALATAVGEFIKAGGPALRDIFKVLAQAIEDIAPLLPELAREVFPLIADLFKELAPVLTDLAKDVLPAVVDILKDVLPYVKEAIKKFGEFADEHPKITALATALGLLALKGGLVSAALGGVTKLTFKFAAKFLLKPLLTKIAGLAKPIGKAMGDMVTKTGKGVNWNPLLGGAGKMSATKALGAVGISFIAFDLAVLVRDGIVEAMGKVDQILPDGPFKDLANSIAATAWVWLQRATGGGDSLFDALWPDRFPWEDDPPPAVDWSQFTGSLRKIQSGVQTALTVLSDKFKPLGDRIYKTGTVLNEKTNGALGKIVDAIKAKYAPVVNGGKTLIDGLKAMIEGRLNAGKPQVESATKTMLGGITGIAQAALHPTVGTAASMVAEVARKLRESKPTTDNAARTSVSGVFAAVKARLSSVPSLGSTAGKGIASGLGGTWSAVNRAARSIGSAAKPPVPNMYRSGQSIGSTFASGIGSLWQTVRDAALSLVNAARNLFPFSPAKEGPFSGKGWVSYSGQSIGEAFADGLLDKVAVAQAAARSMMQAAHSEFEGYKPPSFDGPAFAAGNVGGLDADEVAGMSMNQVIVNVNNINPVAEKGSVSTSKAVQRLATAGVI